MLNYYIKIRMRNDVGHMEIKPLRGTTFIHVYYQDLRTQLQSKMVDLSCCVQNQIVNFPMFFFPLQMPTHLGIHSSTHLGLEVSRI